METENVLIENLLKPRYKVIADYPDARLEVGHIISAYENGMVYLTETFSGSMNDYPHLFKRLEWWEERSEDELPKYVSYVSLTKKERIYGDAKTSDDNFYKARTFVEFKGIDMIHSWYGRTVLPATEQEYTSYINQSKK